MPTHPPLLPAHPGPRGRRRLRTGLLSAAVAVLSVFAIAGPAAADGTSNRCGDAHCTMEQTIRLDPVTEQITLPIYQGTFAGAPVYYIVTDSSDQNDARRRGVNYAPKLRRALGTRAVQPVTESGGVVNFTGTVKFNSTHSLRPGPDGIPPGTTPPGAVGDENYSPLITTGNGIVLNASQIANPSGVHESLVGSPTFGPTAPPTNEPGAPVPVGRATFQLFLGFWNSNPLAYLHMDASSPEVAAVEGSTYAKNLDFAPREGSNDPKESARSAIIPIQNGREARGDPERQGLNSFVENQGDPLNVTQEFPGKGGDRYSPVWDIHQLRWTEAAIAAGQRRRLRSASDVIGEFNHHRLMDTGTGPPNPSLDGIRANGEISNCPIVADLPGVDPGERGSPPAP